MLLDEKHVREGKYIKAIEEMELLQKNLKKIHQKLGKHVTENKLAKIGYATVSKKRRDSGDSEQCGTQSTLKYD